MSSSVSGLSALPVATQASVAVFKKSIQAEQQTAAQLLAAIPQPPAPKADPTATLGRQIDIRV